MMFDCKAMHPRCEALCCCVTPLPTAIVDRNRDKLQRPVIEWTEIPGAKDAGETEFKQMGEPHLLPKTDDGMCPFLKEDLSCGIYEDRPDICKMYGNEISPFMSCHFYDKDGKERTRQGRRQIERKCGSLQEKMMKVVLKWEQK